MNDADAAAIRDILTVLLWLCVAKLFLSILSLMSDVYVVRAVRRNAAQSKTFMEIAKSFMALHNRNARELGHKIVEQTAQATEMVRGAARDLKCAQDNVESGSDGARAK